MIKIYIIIGFLLTPVDFLAQHIVKPSAVERGSNTWKCEVLVG
jgi:hypothetical protein